MIKSRNIRMSRKSKPVKDAGGDPAEAVARAPQLKTDGGYQSLENKYETAGFAITTIFKNWKKTLIIILTMLFMIGVILLLLLPGYKCQTKNGSYIQKTPVELPVKKHGSVDLSN